MKALAIIAVFLFASTASGQTVWQMNAAYQNQINTAQQAARPVYGYGYVPAYRPYYAPRYVAPTGSYGRGLSRWSAEQDQLREMQNTNFTLRMIEWDLQDIANQKRWR